MSTREVLIDAFERVQKAVDRAAMGLDQEGLAFRPEDEANPIGWLVWHLTRVQDDHISEIAGREQAWTEEGWNKRFGMEAEASDTGFGHTPDQVAAFRPGSHELLLGYHDAVLSRTRDYLEKLDDQELERIIDRSYDPPVTVAVRLVSVIADDLQHAGQAAYVRGILNRSGSL